MKLDAQLHDFVIATWEAPIDRAAVAATLQGLDDALRASMIAVREIGAPDAVSIAETVLVVTRDVIVMGWPVHDHNVLWRRASEP